MSDEERAASTNGIWLCATCATKIDKDESHFPVDLLNGWKTGHESWVDAGCPSNAKAPLRDVSVKGGVGAVLVNEGSGTGMTIEGAPGQTAERISVEGQGCGEIIVNTGSGTGKVVKSRNASASESRVVLTKPVKMAAGIMAKLIFATCDVCGAQMQVSKVIQGFAGESEPLVPVSCRVCGAKKMV